METTLLLKKHINDNSKEYDIQDFLLGVGGTLRLLGVEGRARQGLHGFHCREATTAILRINSSSSNHSIVQHFMEK